MPTSDLRALSVELEAETGYDSIPTIERIHGGDCPYLRCLFRRLDPEAMWRHLHFSNTHGLSFGMPLDELLETRSAKEPTT